MKKRMLALLLAASLAVPTSIGGIGTQVEAATTIEGTKVTGKDTSAVINMGSSGDKGFVWKGGTIAAGNTLGLDKYGSIDHLL